MQLRSSSTTRVLLPSRGSEVVAEELRAWKGEERGREDDGKREGMVLERERWRSALCRAASPATTSRCIISFSLFRSAGRYRDDECGGAIWEREEERQVDTRDRTDAIVARKLILLSLIKTSTITCACVKYYVFILILTF